MIPNQIRSKTLRGPKKFCPNFFGGQTKFGIPKYFGVKYFLFKSNVGPKILGQNNLVVKHLGQQKCVPSGRVNISPKMGKPFPNSDIQNHELFPKYDA